MNFLEPLEPRRLLAGVEVLTHNDGASGTFYTPYLDTFENDAYFSTNAGIYVTDGTAHGTRRLLPADRFAGEVRGLTAAADGVFALTEADDVFTLRYTSDAARTTTLGVIDDPGPWRAEAIGGELVFMGAGGSALFAAQASAGSVRQLDVPGLIDFDQRYEIWFKAVGDTVYFNAKTDKNLPVVWRTDGTAGNTKNTGLRSRWEPSLIDGDFYFNRDDAGAARMDLATEQVISLMPRNRYHDGAGQDFVGMGDDVFFIVEEKLWRSGREAHDAVLVGDTDTSWNNSTPVVAGGRVFVPGNIGSSFDRELWTFDGSQLIPINLLSDSSSFDSLSSNPIALQGVGGSLFLLTDPSSSLSPEQLLQLDPNTLAFEPVIDDIDARFARSGDVNGIFAPGQLMTLVNQRLLVFDQNDDLGLVLRAITADFAHLNASADTLTVTGTPGNDVLSIIIDDGALRLRLNGVEQRFNPADVGRIEIFADAGDDLIDFTGITIDTYAFGNDGDDTITAGTGNDTLTGGAGRNRLFGGPGDDRLNGSGGRDFLYGQGGDDRLHGFGGNDRLDGGGGVDRLFGYAGADFLDGGSSNDKLYGGSGNDTLLVGRHDDQLFGEPGADVLDGSDGDDTADTDPLDAVLNIESFI